MTRLPHIEAAVAQASSLVRDTWQQLVMGTLQVPGAITPQVNIGLRQLYTASISVGPSTTTSPTSTTIGACRMQSEVSRLAGRAGGEPIGSGGHR